MDGYPLSCAHRGARHAAKHIAWRDVRVQAQRVYLVDRLPSGWTLKRRAMAAGTESVGAMTASALQRITAASGISHCDESDSGTPSQSPVNLVCLRWHGLFSRVDKVERPRSRMTLGEISLTSVSFEGLVNTFLAWKEASIQAVRKSIESPPFVRAKMYQWPITFLFVVSYGRRKTMKKGSHERRSSLGEVPRCDAQLQLCTSEILTKSMGDHERAARSGLGIQNRKPSDLDETKQDFAGCAASVVRRE
ncbi:hypothetical protein C8R44DRAFT_778926 [Mycena epipterygia]|nr:hypothetical protein C8R44DRAFT_778926 [Mycena epipterygia]